MDPPPPGKASTYKPGGALPYITYTGMCRPTGSWFWSFWFRTEYPFQRRFLERGIKNCGSRLYLLLTALFTDMRILKFKNQLTIAFFAAVNHLDGPPRKRNFTLTGSKGHALWFVIGGFRSVMCVSVFQGSLLGIVIMIDGSEKRNCESGFWTLEFACFWKAQ